MVTAVRIENYAVSNDDFLTQNVIIVPLEVLLTPRKTQNRRKFQIKRQKIEIPLPSLKRRFANNFEVKDLFLI